MIEKQEYFNIINQYITEDMKSVMDFRNFREWNLEEKETFRFTVRLLSLEFLLNLMEDERVKNVYWSPSTPPPGGGTDSISLRYKVYVEFY